MPVMSGPASGTRFRLALKLSLSLRPGLLPVGVQGGSLQLGRAVDVLNARVRVRDGRRSRIGGMVQFRAAGQPRARCPPLECRSAPSGDPCKPSSVRVGVGRLVIAGSFVVGAACRPSVL